MNPVPQHVAIIMDGNGRWAQRRGRPRVFGHIRGTARVKEIVRAASPAGIRALTLYAFSTENWTRPEDEQSALWKILRKFILSEQEELHRQNVRLRFIGETERLDPSLQTVMKGAVERLAGNTGLQLTIALSYGSRRELARAARLFAADCVAGRRSPEEMTEALLWQYLWTSELGELAEVDLVIRTSGEQRVSNFLLWQAAYAEFLFSELSWPEFTKAEFFKALEQFGRRERRFGGVKVPESPGLTRGDLRPGNASGLTQDAGNGTQR
jgi:undecaprenyl diphosphate synthase